MAVDSNRAQNYAMLINSVPRISGTNHEKFRVRQKHRVKRKSSALSCAFCFSPRSCRVTPGIAPLGFPQIRTCGTPASGSSGQVSLGDSKRCEPHALAVTGHVARTPRTAPTAAWHWNGDVTTCARYVRRDAGSSPASGHSPSSRNRHSGHVVCGSVDRAVTSPVYADVVDTTPQWHAMRDSTDPSPSFAAPPSGLSASVPNNG